MAPAKNIYITPARTKVLERARELFPDKSDSRLLFEALELRIEAEELRLVTIKGTT